MGKNTMIRKCIKDYCERKGDNTWMSLYEKMVGNVGVIFTSGELDAVKEKIKEFVVPAPAKAGAIAQVDVEWKFGVTASTDDIAQLGSSFLQVCHIKRHRRRRDSFPRRCVTVCHARSGGLD